jgi:ribosomal protein S4E
VRRYALTNKEVVAIMMQRLVQVDGKVRTDATYPAGFMDVISIEKTDEYFRLLYDTHGRFVVHRISQEEAGYKLCKVRQDRVGKGAVPFIATHDGRTIRYVDPDIKVRLTAPARSASQGGYSRPRVAVERLALWVHTCARISEVCIRVLLLWSAGDWSVPEPEAMLH